MWSAWSACSASCDGLMHRSRQIAQYGRGSGAFCSGGLKETTPCNPMPGDPLSAPAECRREPPVDCAVEEWRSWTACTATCGGGRRGRSRLILTEPQHGGKTCSVPLGEVEECARDACPDERHPVDCQYSQWSEWGECDRCDGQRKRMRSVTQAAMDGGRNCDAFPGEETEECPRKCGEETYCTWASWSPWSACNVRCGEGKRARRRNLELSTQPAATLAPTHDVMLMAEFEDLQKRRQVLDGGHRSALLTAFAGGLLSCLLVLLAMRSVSMLRAHRMPSHLTVLGSTASSGSAPRPTGSYQTLHPSEVDTSSHE